MPVRVLLLCLFFFSAFYGGAQSPFMYHYTVDDGLPSSEVYEIREDRKGYIWVTTDHGVARFNGYEFEHFTSENGLIDNTVVNTFIDPLNRLWFTGIEGSLCYYDGERISPYRYNTQLKRITQSQRLSTFYVDSAENLWFYSLGVHQITNKGKHIIYPEQCSSDHELLRFFFFPDGTCISGVAIRRPGTIRLDGQTPVKQIGRDLYVRTSWKYLSNKTLGGRFVRINDSCMAATLFNTAYFFTNSRVLKEIKIPESMGHLFKLNEKQLWILKRKGILEVNLDNFSVQEGLFKKRTIDYLEQDREGNYWFATLDDGIYFIPSLSVKVPEALKGTEDNKILSMCAYGETQLLMGTSKGNISLFDVTDEHTRRLNHEELGIVDKLHVDQQKKIYMGGLLMVTMDAKGNMQWLDRETFPKSFANGADGVTWVGAVTGFRKFRSGHLLFRSEQFGFDQRVTSLFEDSLAGILYIGAIKGIYTFDGNKVKPYAHPCLNKERIACLQMDKERNLWIGTRGAGLFIKYRDSLYRIDRKQGLPSNMCKSLLLDEENGHAWIGTNKGLSVLSLKSLRKGQIQLSNYSSFDGLPSNEINDIVKMKGQIYLATNNGVAHFNPADIFGQQAAPLLYVKNVYVNERLQRPTTYYELQPHEQNIQIEYEALCYKSQGRISYRYRLEGWESNWNVSSSRTVRYNRLPPGRYTFQLMAYNDKMLAAASPLQMTFYVRQHFSKTAWFRGVLVLFIAVIIYYIGRGIWLRHHMQRELGLLEQKALRAQMTPHFIFNAMNSIQSFIASNNKKSASIYLSSFSMLMRNIMESSKGNLISLADEINTIQHYLELEKLRFGERFQYQVYLDEQVSADESRLPPMFLQPYVENAIWHGLMPREGEVRLMIHACMAGQNLLISIEDNGIGRSESARRNQSRTRMHHSTGMDNISRRITLLNKLYRMKIKISITDLLAPTTGEALGTRIELLIPQYKRL